MGIMGQIMKEKEEKEEVIDEGYIPGTPKAIPINESNYQDQADKICNIIGNKIGTGFFCKIKYKGEEVPVLITNYHVVDDDFLRKNSELKFYINGKSYMINIDSNSKIYSSIRDKYDIMIIRLEEGKIDNYLEIDENIFKENSENQYEKEGIYILHYPKGGKAKVSEGKGLLNIINTDYNSIHFCHTEQSSSGAPILSILTNKVIAIHRGGIKENGEFIYNYGTFLKFPLNELKSERNVKVSNYFLYNLVSCKNIFLYF